MFPYVSIWILGYATVVFLASIIVPLPYGKFSKSMLPLQIDTRLAWGLQHGAVLIGLIFGWMEDGKIYTMVPITNKGWVALTFLWLHFLWRAILSQVVLTKHGTKQTTILLPILSLLYYVPVGCQFRRMCHEIDVSYEPIDTIPFILACICFGLNITIEILYDNWRIDENNCYAFDLPTRKYYGNYLREDFLKERFILFRYGFHTPNYAFEMLEWLFFTLFVFKYEAFWWFVATCLFLMSRSAWTAHWVDEVSKIWIK